MDGENNGKNPIKMDDLGGTPYVEQKIPDGNEICDVRFKMGHYSGKWVGLVRNSKKLGQKMSCHAVLTSQFLS